jgi:hypothetical protein
MCEVAGWPVGAGAEVCAKAVPTPVAEERSIALTSDFIVNSFSDDDAPTPISRSSLPPPEVIVHGVRKEDHGTNSNRGYNHRRPLLPTEFYFLEKNFLEKWNTHLCRRGQNRSREPLPAKGLGVGTTTFRSAPGGSTSGYYICWSCRNSLI